MAQPSLDDSYESVDRARKDIAKLKRNIRDFRKRHSHTVSEDRDASGAYVLTVSPQEVPRRIRADARDILISNLRPALDYLVANLAELDSGKPPKRTQFPICETPALFKDKRKAWLRGVNASHAAAIENLQPYNKRMRWLGLLRDLGNPGKHEGITLIDTNLRGGYEVVERTRRVRRVKPQAPASASAPSESTSARLDELIKFARKTEGTSKRETKPTSRIAIPDKHPLAKSDVHVHLGLTFYIAFENRLPVVPTLEVLESGVRAVLDAFEPEF